MQKIIILWGIYAMQTVSKNAFVQGAQLRRIRLPNQLPGLRAGSHTHMPEPHAMPKLSAFQHEESLVNNSAHLHQEDDG
jgi:hypothetical protein